MKRFKYILIILLAFSLMLFVGCGKDKEPKEEIKKTVFDVVEVPESYNQEYEYDEFKLEYLKIKLIYEDSTEEIIPVTEDMIDEKDLAKLTKAGSPRITINYKDEFQLTYVVKLIDSADLDKNLNKDGKYNAVVKAIRSNDRINFYIEPKDAVAALSFAYTFDSSIMQVSDGSLNPELKGVGDVEIDGNKIKFAYSEMDTLLNKETLLFSVKLTGDFRTSNLRVDDSFNNVVYGYKCFNKNLTSQYGDIFKEGKIYHSSNPHYNHTIPQDAMNLHLLLVE